MTSGSVVVDSSAMKNHCFLLNSLLVFLFYALDHRFSNLRVTKSEGVTESRDNPVAMNIQIPETVKQ